MTSIASITSMPPCMGVTAVPTTVFTTNIADHSLVYIPGGHTVIGSANFEDATPRWVSLSPYLIGETAVSESEYRKTMGRPGREGAPENHPVTMVSHGDAHEYIMERGGVLRFPTEAEWENAARGPAVNIPGRMVTELGRFKASDVVDFVEGRFENLVFGVLGHIFTDPRSEIFQELINDGRPFFGWRVFGTRSGRLTHDEAWFDQDGTAPVNWGPRNAYGLYNMTGNVWEWVQDWYAKNVYMLDGVNPVGPGEGRNRILRCGSWSNYAHGQLQAAYRYYDAHPGVRLDDIGFRVAHPAKIGGVI